jgi:hypothetical protein
VTTAARRNRMRITDRDDPVFQVFEEVLKAKADRIAELETQVATYKDIIKTLTKRAKEAEDATRD